MFPLVVMSVATVNIVESSCGLITESQFSDTFDLKMVDLTMSMPYYWWRKCKYLEEWRDSIKVLLGVPSP